MNHLYKSCICLGYEIESCFHKPRGCSLLLPGMNGVARKLKMKYELSLYSKIIPLSAQQGVAVVETENLQEVDPENMIHFSRSPDYCTANPDYNIAGIAGRECTLGNASSSQHCDNLCCDHGYETFTATEEKPCSCKFVWCCHIECDTCYETVERSRCRNEAEVSSTSHITITNTNTTLVD